MGILSQNVGRQCSQITGLMIPTVEAIILSNTAIHPCTRSYPNWFANIHSPSPLHTHTPNALFAQKYAAIINTNRCRGIGHVPWWSHTTLQKGLFSLKVPCVVATERYSPVLPWSFEGRPGCWKPGAWSPYRCTTFCFSKSVSSPNRSSRDLAL